MLKYTGKEVIMLPITYTSTMRKDNEYYFAYDQMVIKGVFNLRRGPAINALYCMLINGIISHIIIFWAYCIRSSVPYLCKLFTGAQWGIPGKYIVWDVLGLVHIKDQFQATWCKLAVRWFTGHANANKPLSESLQVLSQGHLLFCSSRH